MGAYYSKDDEAAAAAAAAQDEETFSEPASEDEAPAPAPKARPTLVGGVSLFNLFKAPEEAPPAAEKEAPATDVLPSGGPITRY